MSSHNDQRQIRRQVLHRLHPQQDILPLLNRPDIQDKPLGQAIFQSHLFFFHRRRHFRKPGRTTLIHHTHTLRIDLSQLQHIPFGTLADGDDMVCLLDGPTELPRIDLRIDPRIELRMPQEDQVVDGHHTLDSTLPDTSGQLSAQAVIYLHFVFLQVSHDAGVSPQRLLERQNTSLGITKTDPGQSLHLTAQVVTSLVRSIETQSQTVWQIGQVTHQRTSITA